MAKQDMRALGSLGGKATVAKHGTSYMRDIARRGFNATAERLGGPYQVCKMLKKDGKWGYIADKKVGTNYREEWSKHNGSE